VLEADMELMKYINDNARFNLDADNGVATENEARARTHIHTYTHTHIHTYTHYVSVKQTDTRTHAHTHTHTHTHTHHTIAFSLENVRVGACCLACLGVDTLRALAACTRRASLAEVWMLKMGVGCT
jgi:hypothetical protein